MGCHVRKQQRPANLDLNQYQSELDIAISNENIFQIYDIGTVVGQGNFGSVRKAFLIGDQSKNYAVKMIRKERIIDKIHLLGRELQILKTLDHPNIAKFYETYQDMKNVYFVMEYCPDGELFERIIQKQSLSENESRVYMQQIFSAIAYLHLNNFIHRDLKPENLLLSNELIKVIDFGLSRKYKKDSELITKVGTPLYVAPEVLEGVYGKECDNWSLGIIMYILLCGSPPFLGETPEEVYQKIKRGKLEFSEPQWQFVSDDAKDLLKGLIKVDPNVRMTSQQALKHSWFERTHFQHSLSHSEEQKIINMLKLYSNSNSLKKEALRVLINHLNSQEIQDLTQKFKEFDIEETGVLTLHVIQQVMKQMGYNDSENQIAEFIQKFHPQHHEMIEELHINYSEFIAATLDQNYYLNQDNLWMLFQYMDNDRTGFITIKNLKAVMAREGRYLNERELDELMDKRERIDFQEFRKIMK